MNKILIITYYFPPSGGSGVQRWLKFSKYLPEFAWQPIILTVDEKFASYPQIDKTLLKDISPSLQVEKTKTCEILNLYKKVSPEKEIPFGGFADTEKPGLFQKISRFIRGNFFIPDPRRGWNKYAYKQACELIEKENIKYVITTSPPHSTQLVGLKLKNKFPNIKWIADFRDPWTDIHYYKKLYPTAIADKINKAYERKVLEQSDKIIVTSRAAIDSFLSKTNKISANKFEEITNGFDTEDFKHIEQNKLDKFTITYIGILYNTKDIEVLINAFAMLKNKENCKLQFVGHSGIIASEIEKKNLQEYTEILPEVKHSEAIQIMADSSVLVLLAPNKSKKSAFLPGKLFEYLASRRPILCIASPDNEICEIIKNCEAGKSFNYNETEKMLDFLKEQQENWNKNHISLIENEHYMQYSRKELTKKLSNILR